MANIDFNNNGNYKFFNNSFLEFRLSNTFFQVGKIYTIRELQNEKLIVIGKAKLVSKVQINFNDLTSFDSYLSFNNSLKVFQEYLIKSYQLHKIDITTKKIDKLLFNFHENS